MSVGDVASNRHAEFLGDEEDPSGGQSEEHLQGARCGRGLQAEEGLSCESRVVRGHGGVDNASCDPIDDVEEAGSGIKTRTSRIGPLPLHHPDVQAQVDGPVRVPGTPPPAAGEGAAHSGTVRQEVAYEVECRVHCLWAQGVKVEINPPLPRTLGEVLEGLPGVAEGWGLHGKVAVESLVMNRVDGGLVLFGDGARGVALAIPEADGAADPPGGEGLTGPEGVLEGLAGDVGPGRVLDEGLSSEADHGSHSPRLSIEWARVHPAAAVSFAHADAPRNPSG